MQDLPQEPAGSAIKCRGVWREAVLALRCPNRPAVLTVSVGLSKSELASGRVVARGGGGGGTGDHQCVACPEERGGLRGATGRGPWDTPPPVSSRKELGGESGTATHSCTPGRPRGRGSEEGTQQGSVGHGHAGEGGLLSSLPETPGFCQGRAAWATSPCPSTGRSRRKASQAGAGGSGVEWESPLAPFGFGPPAPE